jgi:hypothetical protein
VLAFVHSPAHHHFSYGAFPKTPLNWLCADGACKNAANHQGSNNHLCPNHFSLFFVA